MAYSFPVFRKGMVFKTEQLVSVVEARIIANLIKQNAEAYHSAFRKAVELNNGASSFRVNRRQTIKPHIEESHILNFPAIVFKLKGFSVKSRNSVTVCMHDHRSKIWTRLSCTAINGKPAVDLNAVEVAKFFEVASRKADAILNGLAAVYSSHVKQAGIRLPTSERYFFQLRAFNSTHPDSAELLSQLSSGLPLSNAVDDQKSKPELMDYFSVVLGKKARPAEIKKSIRLGNLDVFGYKSPRHQAIFTARIDERETDICGYGFDDGSKSNGKMFSHAATKDLLKEYAQQF